MNFFVPSAHHSSFSIPVFISSWFNPSHLSLSSSVSAFVSILANRLPRLNPSSFIHLRSYALCVLFVLLFLLPPRRCFDILCRLFWFLASFPFGVSCCVPHCRFDSWRLGVTSLWVVEGPSKTSLFLSSVARLGQSPV